jgi:hypothetical protein
MKYIILLVVTIIQLSCQNKNPYDCKIDKQIISYNDSIMNLDYFETAYDRISNVVDEPDMKQSTKKTFRLMNSHSWDRDIWSYRFEKETDGGSLTIKKTYTESYKKTEGIHDTTLIRTITAEEWEEIEKAFDSNCFWTMSMDINRRGLDGGIYWLEAYDPISKNPVDKEYFTAARWSPENGTAFDNICTTIFEIANLK